MCNAFISQPHGAALRIDGTIPGKVEMDPKDVGARLSGRDFLQGEVQHGVSAGGWQKSKCFHSEIECKGERTVKRDIDQNFPDIQASLAVSMVGLQYLLPHRSLAHITSVVIRAISLLKTS